MESTRSALRLGSPVRFQDRWQGRLAAFEVDEDWTVLNIVVSRGVFRPTQAKLPFSVASHWDEDGLSLDCTSGDAFGRRVPPPAVPARPLSKRTLLSVARVRLVGALVGRSSRRVSHLLMRAGLLTPDQRQVPVEDVTLDVGVLTLSTQAHAWPVYRRDSDLLEAVRDAIAAHRYLTADDRRGLNVEVVDGAAYLSGNVRTFQAETYVLEAASAVPGISAVHGAPINDRQLEIDIGRALGDAGFYRYGRVYVRAALGEVTLGGHVKAAAAAADGARVVAAVPGVRAVENKMEVREPPPPGPPAPPSPSRPEPAGAHEA